MPLTFQIETVDSFWADGQELFPRHFKELSLHQEEIPYGLDLDMYHIAEQNGLLHILSARKDGKMIGYIVSLVAKRHPHNRDAGPYSTTDMFWVMPEHRNGTGVWMLKENERRLRALGVRRMGISTKLKSAHLDLFNRLGYEATDIVFHKLLLPSPVPAVGVSKEEKL